MRTRRIVLVAACIAVAGGVFAIYLRYLREAEARLEPDNLGQRTSLSKPDWLNYDEDIKAQIGAAPVAQWRGRPIAVERDAVLLRVTFELSGVWADRRVALPVLVRDPSGQERRHMSHRVDPPRVTYTYQITDLSPDAPLPWILVKYPHREDRITLDEAGNWKAPS